MKFVPGRRQTHINSNGQSENRTLTVLSVEGKPTLSVPSDAKHAVLRQMVAHRYGYQCIGVPHSWIVQ
jgi:hypothetical protein